MPNMNSEPWMSLMLKRTRADLLDSSDEQLITLLFSKAPTQQQLDKFLDNWDIEAKGAQKALLLSYFMKLHPELTYPPYVLPRLRGLINYYKFQNVQLISHFVKICKALGNAGIKVLIHKGGAMKHLRPDFPRIMGDIDILIPDDRFKDAVRIAETLDYDCSYHIYAKSLEEFTGHSVDLHLKGSESGVMDIHRHLCFDTGFEAAINDDLFARATLQNVFNSEIYVPSKEDLLFILVANMGKNLRNKTSWEGLLFTCYDVQFLIDSTENFRWDIVKENIRKTHAQIYFHIAYSFINSLVPGILPEELEKDFSDFKASENTCIMALYRRIFLHPIEKEAARLGAKGIAMVSGFHHHDFINFMKVKPKYYLAKVPVYLKSPTLAKMRLSLHKKKIAGGNRS